MLAGLGLALALGLVIFASRVTSPAFDELDRLDLVSRSAGVVRDVADRGWSALSSAEARIGGGDGTWFVLLGAWSRLSIGRVGLLDPLTSARLPWLVLTALGSFGVYWLGRRGMNRRGAAMAAALLALHPAWLHAAAVTAESAVMGSTWILVSAAYLQSQSPRSPAGGGPALAARVGWALGAALLLGAGVALCRASLWIVPGLFVHYSLTHREVARRLVAQGRWPLPVVLCVAAAVVPCLVWLLTPSLWSASAPELARWWLAPLSSSRWAEGLGGGLATLGSLGWLVRATPVLTLLCFLAGLVVVLGRMVAGRSRVSGARGAQAYSLDLLILTGMVFTWLLPPWWPRVLAAPAPRLETALPFFALAAGSGVDVLAKRWVGERRAQWATMAVAALAAMSLGVSEFRVSGANRWARAAPGDGSEVGALASAIDRLGAPRLTIAAPEVPAPYWQALGDWGRVGTELVPSPRASADLVLVSGARPGGAVTGTVRFAGRALWTLWRQ